MLKLLRYSVAASCLALATAAVAQDNETVADRVESRLDRLDRPEPRELRGPVGPAGIAEPAKKPPFTFTLTLPFTFNSNVENADSGTRSAFHSAPSALLQWKRQTGTFRPFTRVVVDNDYYTRHSENDASSISARFGFQIVSKDLGHFTPYAHYTPVAAYVRAFKDHQVTLHTFAAGVRGDWESGDLTIGLDLQVARREATIAAVEQNRAGLTIELSGPISEQVGWSISQAVQGRAYTGGTNDGREDVNLTTTAGLTWEINDRTKLELGASFEHNASNRAMKDYSTFDVGPSLSFTYKFGA